MSSNFGKKRLTAAELMNQLQKDPAYLVRMEAKKKEHEERIDIASAQAAPILQDLTSVGYVVQSLDELRTSKREYRAAISVLLRWLPRVQNVRVKDSIVRALSVPWSTPEVAPVLIKEFELASNVENSGLKWVIGNALSVIADDNVLDKLIDLARNPQHGKAREMLVLALANVKNDKAKMALKILLKDEDVCGYAIMALGKIGSKDAAIDIEPFLTHPKEWVREEARKALTLLK
jgi:HEAT repeat protein